jgi:toxin YoeB
MILSFHKDAFLDYLDWELVDYPKFSKINSLIKDILRHPFTGIGKPEPLKYQNEKFWSRRITEEHRLIYQVRDDSIIVISCRGHYK